LVGIEGEQLMLSQAIAQAGGQRLGEFSIAGITGRDMFNVNNLLLVIGWGGEVIKES
jgi:hypothetical protein